MIDFQVAVLSDIHGNRWALEAVLQDIRRREIPNMVNLGDCVYGPLDPAGTAQILMEHDPPSVRGNEDRIIWEEKESPSTSPTLQFVRKSLSPEQLYYVSTLRATAIAFDRFFLCHGTPARDDEYLLSDVRKSGVIYRKPKALMEKTKWITQSLIFCGHDHLPCSVHLPNGDLIVNPGSVGLQAFVDEFPFPHSMETGSPHARYSLVQKKGETWSVEDIPVPYDWEKAASVASTNGRPDWAEWLRTGKTTI